MPSLPFGIYEKLIDEGLSELLRDHPELRSAVAKLDPEEEPRLYATFVARVLEKALQFEPDSERRRVICNRILKKLTGEPDLEHLRKHRLIRALKPILLEIKPPNFGDKSFPRPHSPLAESSLFTGSPAEPQLAHELAEEMRSADGVDVLVSFIKWSGLRLLRDAFEDLRDRDIPVRLITTSYMGASDVNAIEWLAGLPNVEVRISYDTERTRLHAKAWHFRRHSGFSTAYIGSANMSHVAMTSGLEWNLKVTAQDMRHILEKFTVEFETYWHSRDFVPFDPEQPEMLRKAIDRARNPGSNDPAHFFDLHPHPFQERILEALQRERQFHDRRRNLVIAATGTGKTVVAAFDFRRFYEERRRQARLLFVAHRQEILQQALTTFRHVLREQNFGHLLVGRHEAAQRDHLFCSIGMLNSRRLWDDVGRDFYDYIVLDEAHHGKAESYRSLFAQFNPHILLGLTATPERMDGLNVAADFGNRFAAEIRLPEALAEKLLCPFHYFGVADPVAIDNENFWHNGRYDENALENVYVLDRVMAGRRVGAIVQALERYEPDFSRLKGIGFCVTIRHAEFMAEEFNRCGIPSAAFVSTTNDELCAGMLSDLRAGRLKFLFTVDKLSEGVDVPEINIVLFLRPTESLTVFLQQLGRGLRHAPEKDCLTVLDFVGQAHRRYRIDTKLKALLPRHRFSIDKEVEQNFPHLPTGCSIQLDRISRQYVLENIKANLAQLNVQIPERIQSFTSDSGQELTFGNFLRYHNYEPEILLNRMTWSEWKGIAGMIQPVQDPDLQRLRKTLLRAAFIDGPREIARMSQVVSLLSNGAIDQAVEAAGQSINSVYYRLWGERGSRLEIHSMEEAFRRLAANRSIIADLAEIFDWALDATEVSGEIPQLLFDCPLELHARYNARDVQAAFGRATLETSGQTGVGVFHFPDVKSYALLVTFQKTEKEFSPTTMYDNYPISRELLHWESQSTTARHHQDGQNLIGHRDRGYTVLVFARDRKKRNNVTVPFTYLGPVDVVSFESERPIRFVWRLRSPMPVEMFEDNRKGG
jgi:superfamily II DNA or RNA helicase